MKKHVIAVVNAKGGIGKTSIVGTIGHAAKRDGLRVLVVDLDPQENLSTWYGADYERPDAYSLFNGEDPADCIQGTKFGIDIIAGTGDLIDVTTTRASARRLEAALDAVKKDYDLIAIDSPPIFGELQNNAILAANEILIPADSDSYSLQGIAQIRDLVDEARQTKPRLKYAGAVVSLYDGRPVANRELRQLIEDYSNDAGIPYLGELRRCIKMREAMEMQASIFDYAPRSNAALDYMALYERIMKGGSR